MYLFIKIITTFAQRSDGGRKSIMYPDYFEIDNVVVNSEIVNTNFTCDVAKCKGACCTMESEYGAPITKNEIEEINNFLPAIIKYLPDEHIEEIQKNGFWIEKNGELTTRSLNNRACVFVIWEGDIAKCGIEEAYNAGKIDFFKPISCHLFPIRISTFGGPVLRYERYSECVHALDKGDKTKIKILDFCRPALERKFGVEWFNKTKEVVNT